MSLRPANSPMRPLAGLLGWLALAFATAALGALASVQARDFYRLLHRPAWAPPAGVFGPVWTVLYLLLGLASWLVWRERGGIRVQAPLALYGLQLALNALWSWLFFAWHLGAWAFLDILVLWILVLATLMAFRRVRPLAALLLAPYLAWITFAAALCFAVWRLNPSLLG